MSQVAHPAGAYPIFCGMKQLGVLFSSTPELDASPLQGYRPHPPPPPPPLKLPVPIYMYTPEKTEAI